MTWILYRGVPVEWITSWSWVCQMTVQCGVTLRGKLSLRNSKLSKAILSLSSTEKRAMVSSFYYLIFKLNHCCLGELLITVLYAIVYVCFFLCYSAGAFLSVILCRCLPRLISFKTVIISMRYCIMWKKDLTEMFIYNLKDFEYFFTTSVWQAFAL